MKYVVTLLMFCVMACASNPPAATTPPPSDGLVHVYGDQKTEIASIDPKSGKVDYKNGGSEDKVILVLLKNMSDMNTYHENFKRDMATLIADQKVKKAPAPKKKEAEKK